MGGNAPVARLVEPDVTTLSIKVTSPPLSLRDVWRILLSRRIVTSVKIGVPWLKAEHLDDLTLDEVRVYPLEREKARKTP